MTPPSYPWTLREVRRVLDRLSAEYGDDMPLYVRVGGGDAPLLRVMLVGGEGTAPDTGIEVAVIEGVPTGPGVPQ